MNTVTKTADLPVSPDEAFALVTEPERLRRWQAVSASIELRAGGSYRFTVTPGNTSVGTVLEVEPGRRIVYAWGWEHEPLDSTVTVTIEPTGTGSRVTLVHEGLDEQQAKGHDEGWTHFMERLEKAAAAGDAGPDAWAFAPENLNPLVAAEAALAVLQPVLRSIKPADATAATPCSEYDVDALVGHLLESLAGLGAMAGAEVSEPAHDTYEDRVSTLAGDVITAWKGVDLAGTVQTPGGERPADFVVRIIALELLLHGWDLAQATGQVPHVADSVVAYIRELTTPVVEAVRGSSIKPAVEAPAGASPLDAFAAFAGRTPLA